MKEGLSAQMLYIGPYDEEGSAVKNLLIIYQGLLKNNIIDIEILADGQEYRIGEYLIEAIRLEEDYVYGFIINDDNTAVLIVMDELVGWKVPDNLDRLDLAI